jgi:hypothetical protein
VVLFGSHIFHKPVSFVRLRPQSLFIVSLWSRWSFWVSFGSHLGLTSVFLGGSHFGHQHLKETHSRPKRDLFATSVTNRPMV